MAMNAEELEQLRDSLRALLDEIAPIETVRAWDRADHVPPEILQRFGELGVTALAVDEEYGGLGRDVSALLVVLQEVARRSIMLAGLIVQCTNYAGLNIGELGSEAQKREYLPRVANGTLIFALGLSEPNVGADLASVETRAEIRGDKVIINGAKRWCSGAEIADCIYALVRSGPVADRYKNLSFVIIPRETKGISMTTTGTMGMRGVPTNDVVFEDVEIPIENILGGPDCWNKGWSQLAGPTLETEKLSPSAMALGLGEAAMEAAWNYAQERSQFGMRICGHQAVRHSLADMQTRLQTCRLMLKESAAMLDRGEPSAVQTSMTKLYLSETIRDIVIECQQVMGAYGYSEDFDMERYVRDAMVLPIFGGSTAVQKNNIASLMRLPKS